MSHHWPIRDFINCFEGKQLIKPRIQRQKRWKDDDNRDYILFLLKWRESAMPFLLNERIIDSKKVYYLFDGNNRANAILDFVLKPLFFFAHLIPKNLPEPVQELLRDIPLTVLTKPRYNLAKLYRDYEIKNEDNPSVEQDEQFEELLVEVDGWKFLDVHLSMTIKQNLTDEDMCSLYTSINKGGKVLSKQELLASITFPVKYYTADLGVYYQPFVTNITSYYGDMCIHEKLNVEQFGSNSLTLFEVLVAFQMYLSQTYTFIPPYSGEEEKDVVFSLYEFFGGPVDRRWEDLLTTLTHVHEACALLNDCFTCMYDPALKLNRQVRLKKFATLLIVVFIIYHRDNLHEAGFVSLVRRLCAYHELVNDLPSDDDRERYASLDALRIPPGVFSKRYLNNLSETHTFDRMPTVEDLTSMVRHILTSDTHYTSTRKRTSRVKALALSAFFNFQIPSHRKLEMQDIDHIIPYSTKRRHTVDVCRLGNLQLIPSTINRVRQTKPITDRWVKDNDLLYQCYPNQAEYESICSDGVLMDADAFNEMCERREQLYVKQIARLFG